MNRLVHLGIYKGGAHLEISAGTQGDSDLVLLPSSPKGEIVGIMMHVLYLMETNS